MDSCLEVVVAVAGNCDEWREAVSSFADSIAARILAVSSKERVTRGAYGLGRCASLDAGLSDSTGHHWQP